MFTRRIKPTIKIAGTDVTRDLSPYLLSINYQDNLSGEADTLDIELKDDERLFIGEWFPDLASTLQVSLAKNYWNLNDELDLGTFEIDEICAAFAPSTFKIKAVSISQNSSLRQKDESKAWENLKLSELAAQIAKDSGVELFYEATYDPELKRVEQGEQSRLAFLEKICAENYLALKVSDGKLIIFDESKLDEQEPIATIERDKSPVLRFSATKTLQEIYKSAEVSYKHGEKDELFQGRFDSGAQSGKVSKINKKVEEKTETIRLKPFGDFFLLTIFEESKLDEQAPVATIERDDSGTQSGKVLKINKRVEDKAAAERLAKNELREKNKKAETIRLEVVGDFLYLAGNVIELKGFGKFDGKYLIERARHSVGKGYECSLEMRRCLGY